MQAAFFTKRWQVSLRSCFTLIEVLVVVAIIALLVAVLIPSLAKARDHAQRAVCSSNLHQQALGMSSYGADHKGTLPARGWKSYTVAENMHETYGYGGPWNRCLSNVGILRGMDRGRSWVGKEWNLLYCPKLSRIRDMAPSYGGREPSGGAATHEDTRIYWTWGGYNYSVPLSQRFRRKFPHETKTQYDRARLTNPGSYPILGEKNVYPRDYIAGGYWQLLQRKQGLPPDWENGIAPRIPQGCQALVSDWSLGGSPAVHGNGVNVMYSDGHAKFLYCDATIGHSAKYATWYYYNQHR